MDIISLIIGFIIGVVVVSLAIEIGIKKSTQNNPASKHTKKWSISEISNPRVMAEYLNEIDLPKDSKVLVNKYKTTATFAGLDVKEHKGIKGNYIDVKEHKGIKGNYIVGDDRALILAGPIKKDEVAFWTVEKDIVKRLNQEFDDMWAKGSKMESEKES
jgi:hypothetical protein